MLLSPSSCKSVRAVVIARLFIVAVSFYTLEASAIGKELRVSVSYGHNSLAFKSLTQSGKELPSSEFSFNSSNRSLGIHISMDIWRKLYLEAGFYNLDKTRITSSNRLRKSGDVTFQGTSIMAGVVHPITDKIEISGKVGAFRLSYKTDLDYFSLSRSIGLSASVSLAYIPISGWGASVNYVYYGQGLRVISLGLVKKFSLNGNRQGLSLAKSVLLNERGISRQTATATRKNVPILFFPVQVFSGAQGKAVVWGDADGISSIAVKNSARGSLLLSNESDNSQGFNLKDIVQEVEEDALDNKPNAIVGQLEGNRSDNELGSASPSDFSGLDIESILFELGSLGDSSVDTELESLLVLLERKDLGTSLSAENLSRETPGADFELESSPLTSLEREGLGKSFNGDELGIQDNLDDVLTNSNDDFSLNQSRAKQKISDRKKLNLDELESASSNFSNSTFDFFSEPIRFSEGQRNLSATQHSKISQFASLLKFFSNYQLVIEFGESDSMESISKKIINILLEGGASADGIRLHLTKDPSKKKQITFSLSD